MKRIVLLSDGTGNSSAKLLKTNVWRLYQALDLDPASADVVQIACYNDGVGTSAFRPLALLGGIFGYGLKRNVLHLFDFLCEHWEPGDEVYIFGFSRGAFTARILAGLIAREGLLCGRSGAELAYATRDLYRSYRVNPNVIISTPPVVKPFRLLRDTIIRVWRWSARQDFPPAGLVKVPHIAFLGVWDTVAAYGSPLAELTRGIDDWIFPLSMPDRLLNKKVRAARHALALDDERDTFHPLLWDEIKSENPDRIKQIWFAGMHADVGGGYPDDSLSFPPLDWMMREAAQAGLRFLSRSQERFAPPRSRSALLHDSRKGLAGYYRYQPRRLDAYLLPPNPQTVIMVDPRAKAEAYLPSILLHYSVLDRIRCSTERYAPIVLPEHFHVVQEDGTVTSSPESDASRTNRIAGQARVWDDVWRKRVNYFIMVAVSLVMGSSPFWATGPEAGACEAWYCAISPVIQAVGAFVPGILQYWTNTLAAHPAWTMLFIVGFGLLLYRGASLQQQIQDRMWLLLAPLRGGGPAVPQTTTNWVRRLRTSSTYLSFVKWVKWSLLPTALGSTALAALLIGIPLILSAPVLRQIVANAESNGTLCQGIQPDGGDGLFHTNMTCWTSGKVVAAGTAYRLKLTIQEVWMDDTIPAGPEGIGNDRFRWLLGYLGLPARRTLTGRWFQPFVTIVSTDGSRHVQPLEFRGEGNSFVATMVARSSGQMLFWVNDAVVDWFRLSGKSYVNNHGSASIQIEERGKWDSQ